MAKKPARKLQTRAAPRPQARPSLKPSEASAKAAAPRRLSAVIETTTVIASTPEPTFKERVARLLGQNRAGGIDPEQLAQVREGVMEELRRHGGSGQPFEKVLLPLPRRRRGVPLWLAGSVTALVVLGALVWWAGRPPAGAELALHHIEEAIATRNTAAFERLVDTPTLSSHVAAQVFTPQTKDGAPFEASVLAHLQNVVVTARAGGASLPEMLNDQILSAVSAGRWPVEPGSLLGQLWQQLGGEHLKVGHPRIVESSPGRVEAELPLRRDDVTMDVALRLVLEKKDNQWQLVDLPNLAQALGVVSDAVTATSRIEENLNAVAPAAAPVTVDVLQAVKEKPNRVVARLNLANMSGLPVHDVRMTLVIGDADGRPLKQVDLQDNSSLAPTQNVEKQYVVMLDAKHPLERHIIALPLTALTVRVSVSSVK